MHRLTLGHLPAGQFCTFANSDYTGLRAGDPHTHDFHELFWVEEGEGIHWINDQQIPLAAGDLILIRASDAHSFSASSAGGCLRLVNFAFLAELWRHFRRRYFRSESLFFSAPELEARAYRLDSNQLSLLHRLAAPLRAGKRDLFQVESFLFTVLALLRAERSRSGPGAAPAWIQRVCAALARDGAFAGGTPALVRLAGRSPEHIAREFRRHLGRTPTDVINDIRMAHAAERLSTTDETIIAIALDCGLENLSHFYRLFQARFGCTPKAYRLLGRSISGVSWPGAVGRPQMHRSVA